MAGKQGGLSESHNQQPDLTLMDATTDSAFVTYFRGDAAQYTGETKLLHGGLFYAARLLEGMNTGKVIWTMTSPDGVSPWTERAQADYRAMQDSFRHLRQQY